MQNIILLGSTGSIGAQALEVVKKLGNIKVLGLACESNIKLLAQQIKAFSPLAVSLGEKNLILKLEQELKKLKVKKLPEIYFGEEGLIKLAALKSSPNSLVIGALVGAVGIKPIIAAIELGCNIALANKEVLVCAGELVMKLARKKEVKILPIDSEHSAIWQCLKNEETKNINKIILTCSGGPFLGKTKKDLESITVKQALNHPKWKMGGKISIDSATLMNKGLEAIEARWLFGIKPENMEVIIHKESIIHSLVEFSDHSALAQLSLPDMRIPIQCALTYPERKKNNLASLNLAQIKNLSFSKPDLKNFPCLSYAFRALEIGGTMPCALNAANEIAVDLFLKNKIKFLDISKSVKNILENYKAIKNYNLADVYQADKEAREMTRKYLTSKINPV